MSSEQNCLNISRAPASLKAVPQEVPATMMIVVTTVRLVYICTNFSDGRPQNT